MKLWWGLWSNSYKVEVKFVRSWGEVCAKLRWLSYKVVEYIRSSYTKLEWSSYEVGVKFVRSCGVVSTKLGQFQSVDCLAPILLWCERVIMCFGSGELIKLSQVLWLCTVSTNGSEYSIFGKMGTRHQSLQSYWQKIISQPQDTHFKEVWRVWYYW